MQLKVKLHKLFYTIWVCNVSA